VQITVNVDHVDLTSIIGSRRVGTSYEDEHEEPFTLADAIAEKVAADLRKDNHWPDLKTRVAQIRDEEIREHLRPIVADAVAAPIKRTNVYGEPTGQQVTLIEHIVTEAQAMLNRPVDGSRSQTLVQKLIREQVDRALVAELRAAVTDEKTKVIAAIRNKAAELLTEAIKQGIRA
jgi:hypothetical protein